MSKLRVLPDSFERPEVCGPCGGACCKTMPGHAFPSDLGADISGELRARLATGKWAIDWWEGDPREGKDELDYAYYLRPATIGKEGQLEDASWGGQCTFLRDDGCSIFDQRPTGCRGLEPAPGGDPSKCQVRHGTKRDAAIAWIPFHAEILAALNETSVSVTAD